MGTKMTKQTHFAVTTANGNSPPRASTTAQSPPVSRAHPSGGVPKEEEEEEEKKKKQELIGALRNTRSSQVPCTGKDVVEVGASMSPLESARVLWENHVMGAPVWDEEAREYVGIFDMRDLLSTVLLEQSRKDAQRSDDHTSDLNATWFLDNLHTAYLAARNPFVPDYHQDTTLLDLCKVLCRKETHMVPLVDPTTKRCVRVLSKSYIVKFLSENVTLPQLTLQEAKFPYKKRVIQAPDNVSAQQVFELMDRYRLSGIAIIDSKTRKLVANTSASDIKSAIRVGDDSGVVLDMKLDILSYLAQVRQHSTIDRYPCAHVHESSTVAHAVDLLSKTGLHRVFVVNDQMHPVGVVSVTDVVQYIVRCVEEEDEAQRTV